MSRRQGDNSGGRNERDNDVMDEDENVDAVNYDDDAPPKRRRLLKGFKFVDQSELRYTLEGDEIIVNPHAVGRPAGTLIATNFATGGFSVQTPASSDQSIKLGDMVNDLVKSKFFEGASEYGLDVYPLGRPQGATSGGQPLDGSRQAAVGGGQSTAQYGSSQQNRDAHGNTGGQRGSGYTTRRLDTREDDRENTGGQRGFMYSPQRTDTGVQRGFAYNTQRHDSQGIAQGASTGSLRRGSLNKTQPTDNTGYIQRMPRSTSRGSQYYGQRPNRSSSRGSFQSRDANFQRGRQQSTTNRPFLKPFPPSQQRGSKSSMGPPAAPATSRSITIRAYRNSLGKVLTDEECRDNNVGNGHCPSCGRDGHELIDCLKWGTQHDKPGCVACNSIQHDPDVCPVVEHATLAQRQEWFLIKAAGRPGNRSTYHSWTRYATMSRPMPAYPLSRVYLRHIENTQGKDGKEWPCRAKDLYKEWDYEQGSPFCDPELNTKEKIVEAKLDEAYRYRSDRLQSLDHNKRKRGGQNRGDEDIDMSDSGAQVLASTSYVRTPLGRLLDAAEAASVASTPLHNPGNNPDFVDSIQHGIMTSEQVPASASMRASSSYVRTPLGRLLDAAEAASVTSTPLHNPYQLSEFADDCIFDDGRELTQSEFENSLAYTLPGDDTTRMGNWSVRKPDE